MYVSSCHTPAVIHALLVAGVLYGPVGIAVGGGFPSENVTLLSQVALDDFPGQPIRGNDCWGYVSPSGREYAIMGLQNGTGFVEITDPGNPTVLKPHSTRRVRSATIPGVKKRHVWHN